MDKVTVTLDSVIYSPAETLVRYVVEKPMFSGSYSTSGADLSHYLEVAGRRLDPVRVNGLWSADGSAVTMLEVFPVVSGPGRRRENHHFDGRGPERRPYRGTVVLPEKRPVRGVSRFRRGRWRIKDRVATLPSPWRPALA